MVWVGSCSTPCGTAQDMNFNCLTHASFAKTRLIPIYHYLYHVCRRFNWIIVLSLVCLTEGDMFDSFASLNHAILWEPYSEDFIFNFSRYWDIWITLQSVHNSANCLYWYEVAVHPFFSNIYLKLYSNYKKNMKIYLNFKIIIILYPTKTKLTRFVSWLRHKDPYIFYIVSKYHLFKRGK
jgi:hypothetical protein